MRSLLAAALLLSAAVCVAAACAEQPAYESDPAFVKQRTEALALEKQRGEQLFAADAWRKANKTAHGQCMECYSHAIRNLRQMGDGKAALKEATTMEAAAQQPAWKADAELQQGMICLAAAGDEKFKAPLLEQAHAAFAKAYATQPNHRSAMFYDGMTLARLDRNAEAAAAFQSYMKLDTPGTAYYLRAQHFSENPELARHKMAPAIEVTTLSGKHFNLDDMHGRVVLIDFWATWCGPCNQELPHMQKLARKYQEDPFEIVSISWDDDDAKWKDFIASHGMTWNQYRDANHALSRAFGVEAIPHYFTIDSDGVLTAENVGSGSMADGRIDKLVQRAREAQREKVATQAQAAAPSGAQ